MLDRGTSRPVPSRCVYFASEITPHSQMLHFLYAKLCLKGQPQGVVTCQTNFWGSDRVNVGVDDGGLTPRNAI